MRLRSMDDVGLLMLAERHCRSMTQSDMAALLGLTRQKVQLIEAGQPGVAAEMVLRVLADLGVLLLALPSTGSDVVFDAKRTVEDILRRASMASASLDGR